MFKIKTLAILFTLCSAILIVGLLANKHLPADSWVASVLNPLLSGEKRGAEESDANPSHTGSAATAISKSPENKQLYASPDTPHHRDTNRVVIDDKKLAELIDKHISPSMRHEINNMLKPGGKPPATIKHGEMELLDTSDRAATVVIGIIDENDELIVTDFTSPLPDAPEK